MTPRPQPIRDKVQLLVEGREAKGFFDALITHLRLENIQLQNFGSVSQLRTFLSAFTKRSGFARVTSVGIVRDAETNAIGAFDSVRGSLRRAGLPIPNECGQPAGNRPAITVMILPGGPRPGMLETLLCETFSNEGVRTCIDTFFECVEDLQGGSVHRPDKARARAYLATKRDPHLSVGNAAKRGYWNLDHTVLHPLHTFLRAITSAQ